jgi:UDP-N-acetylmuramate--alanine ligase
MDALFKIDRDLITFGFGEKACVSDKPIRVRGVNVSVTGRTPSMDVLYDGELVCKIKLQIPGKHNLENALAATAACLAAGISPSAVEEGLFGYTGVGRRFEYKGIYNGADIYDDYAHHPYELHALLNAVETLNAYKRVILAFQPHTYSRTKALFTDFIKELQRPDIVFLAEIYAARESNDISISSGAIADAIPGARYISDFSLLTDEVRKVAQEGDIILTVGAGDIFKVGEELVEG